MQGYPQVMISPRLNDEIYPEVLITFLTTVGAARLICHLVKGCLYIKRLSRSLTANIPECPQSQNKLIWICCTLIKVVIFSL